MTMVCVVKRGRLIKESQEGRVCEQDLACTLALGTTAQQLNVNSNQENERQ